jgi:hypothetical protein
MRNHRVIPGSLARRLSCGAVLAAVCFLVGCFPLSFSPLYTGEDDIVYDTALLGQWHVDGHPDDAWSFEPIETGDAYVVRGTQQGATGQFRGVLVQVGDRRFLDLFPIGHEPDVHAGYAVHILPAHSIWRVTAEPDRLRLALPNEDRVVALLEAEPDAIAHRIVYMDDDQRLPRVVFTAESAAFQAFVRDRLDDSFFRDEVVLVRAP